KSTLQLRSCRMTVTQSPCRTVFARCPLMSWLLCSLFILVLSFVLGFASFTRTRKQARHEENLVRRRGWLGLTRVATRGTGEISAPGVSVCKRRTRREARHLDVSDASLAEHTEAEQEHGKGLTRRLIASL